MRARRGALGSGTAVRLARRAIAPPAPVARILAWRHARQLDNCHLESSASDSQRRALTPPWTPPARCWSRHGGLAPCTRVAAMPRGVVRSPKAHPPSCCTCKGASEPRSACLEPPSHHGRRPCSGRAVRASDAMRKGHQCSPVRLQEDPRHCVRRVGGRDLCGRHIALLQPAAYHEDTCLALSRSEQPRSLSGLTAAEATAPLRPNLVDALKSSRLFRLERTLTAVSTLTITPAGRPDHRGPSKPATLDGEYVEL